MKRTKKSKKPVVAELANQLDKELSANLPITILPNGSIVYKNYIIKQLANGNWGIYNRLNKDLVEQYFLKSCALMAAKAHSLTKVEKFLEIKRLDNRYWASYCDTMIYKNNIKNAVELDRYLILLTKLEHSTTLTEHFKDEISRMFRWSFV